MFKICLMGFGNEKTNKYLNTTHIGIHQLLVGADPL